LGLICSVSKFEQTPVFTKLNQMINAYTAILLILYLAIWGIGIVLQYLFVKKLVAARVIQKENSISRSIKLLKILFRGDEKASAVVSKQERICLASFYVIQLMLLLWLACIWIPIMAMG